MYIKIAIFAVLFILTVVCTWVVQNWRWEAKQTAAITQAVTASQEEAKQAAAAATAFEKQMGKSDAKYKQIQAALNKAVAAPGAAAVNCLAPDSVHLVNSALSRKAAAPSGLAGPVPGLNPAQ